MASDIARRPPEDRRLRVLIVDDSHDAADSLAMLVRLWGYEVRTAYSAPEGFVVALAFQPDIVFLDLGMPGMDGYSLARQLRDVGGARTPKIVAVTGHAEESHRQRCRAAGFDGFMVKPVEPAAIEAILGRLART